MTRRIRELECVEAWPECHSFGYDPRCCRFPKSCSADIGEDEYAERLALGVPERVFVIEPGDLPIVAPTVEALSDLIRTMYQLVQLQDGVLWDGEMYGCVDLTAEQAALLRQVVES